MRIKLISFLILAIYLLYCCRIDTKCDELTIDLSKYDSVVDLRQFTSSIQVIKLQTTSESLISGINKIVGDDSLLIVLDKMTKSILFFHSNGSFSHKIQHWGKGYGEYIAIQDMDVDKEKKRILVFDDHTKRLISYDYQGLLLSEIYISDFLIRSFAQLRNGNYLAFKPDLSKDPWKDGIWEIDIDGNLIREYADIDKYNKLGWLPYPYFTRIDETFSFLNYYDDYIYSLENRKLKRKLKIHIKQKLPDKFLTFPDGKDENCMDNYYLPTGLNETDHFYHLNNISFVSKPKSIHVFVEKETRKQIIADSIIYDFEDYRNIEKIFSNDGKDFFGLLESNSNENPAIVNFNLKSFQL